MQNFQGGKELNIHADLSSGAKRGQYLGFSHFLQPYSYVSNKGSGESVHDGCHNNTLLNLKTTSGLLILLNGIIS